MVSIEYKMGVTNLDDDSLLSNENVIIKKETINKSNKYVVLVNGDTSDSSEGIDIGLDL